METLLGSGAIQIFFNQVEGMELETRKSAKTSGAFKNLVCGQYSSDSTKTRVIQTWTTLFKKYRPLKTLELLESHDNLEKSYNLRRRVWEVPNMVYPHLIELQFLKST